MNYECILICATGRSGSTTLQRIVNTIPDTNICGENDNAILRLLEFYTSVKKCNTVNNKKYSDFVKNNKKPCWYNNFDLEEIKKLVQNMICTFLNGKANCKIFGFKEIRYSKENFHLLQAFQELFPKTKFIFHIRKDVNSQSKSGWFKDDPNSLDMLQSRNVEFQTFSEKKDKLEKYFSTFEDLFDRNKLRQLFRFLQKEDSFNEIEIQKILDNNQG